ALLSLAGGFIDVPHFLSGSSLGSAGEAAAETPAGGAKTLEYAVYGISLACFLAGLAAAWALYVGRPELRARLIAGNRWVRGAVRLSAGKLHVDEIYDALFVKPLQGLAGLLYTLVDRILIDLLAVEGAGGFTRSLGAL